jgi:hypothetical protein
MCMWMWMWMRRCGCVSVAVAEREPHDLGQCSHLHMGSLGRNSIGAAGALSLGAALRVNNTTLTTLKLGRDVDVDENAL